MNTRTQELRDRFIRAGFTPRNVNSGVIQFEIETAECLVARLEYLAEHPGRE